MAIFIGYTRTCKPNLITGNSNPLEKLCYNSFLNKDPRVAFNIGIEFLCDRLSTNQDILYYCASSNQSEYILQIGIFAFTIDVTQAVKTSLNVLERFERI